MSVPQATPLLPRSSSEGQHTLSLAGQRYLYGTHAWTPTRVPSSEWWPCACGEYHQGDQGTGTRRGRAGRWWETLEVTERVFTGQHGLANITT